MTQAPGAPHLTSLFLVVTALSILGAWGAVLSSLLLAADARRVGLAAALSLAGALLALALPAATGLYSIGIVYPRLLASATLAQALAGLVFGACLGYLAQLGFRYSPGGGVWGARITLVGSAVLACYVVGVVVMQIGLIPKFRLYAREWDARHQLIIELREAGVDNIEVKPYSFDMSAYIAANGLPIEGSDAYFYGVASIEEARS